MVVEAGPVKGDEVGADLGSRVAIGNAPPPNPPPSRRRASS